MTSTGDVLSTHSFTSGLSPIQIFWVTSSVPALYEVRLWKEEAEAVGETLLALRRRQVKLAAGASTTAIGRMPSLLVAEDQVVAHLADVTCLDAVHLQGLIPQQAVAVVLGDAVEDEGLLGLNLVLLRLIVDQGLARQAMSQASTVVALFVPAVGFLNWESFMPSLAAQAFIRLAEESVLPARCSAMAAQASLPDWMMPLFRSSTGDLLAHLDEHLGESE